MLPTKIRQMCILFGTQHFSVKLRSPLHSNEERCNKSMHISELVTQLRGAPGTHSCLSWRTGGAKYPRQLTYFMLQKTGDGQQCRQWSSSWGTAGGPPKPFVFVRITLFTASPMVFVERNFVPVAVAGFVGVDINVTLEYKWAPGHNYSSRRCSFAV